MTDYGASVWVSLYLGTGLLWSLWNANSSWSRHQLARGGFLEGIGLLIGIVLGTLLWPLWAGITLTLSFERRHRKSPYDGGDLP